MMRLVIPLFFVVFCVPSCAAATLNAGVVDGVWFSTNEPRAGEPVTLYTAVHNQSEENVSGSVAFVVDEDIIGTADFRVAPNDIARVAHTHVFSRGTFNVRAYIVASETGEVASAIAPSRTLTVAGSEPSASSESASSRITLPDLPLPDELSVPAITDALTATQQRIDGAVAPRTEAAAAYVETLRDELLATTTLKETHAEERSAAADGMRAAAEGFARDARAITTADDITWWQKVAGVALSLLALLLRVWFVLVVLAVAFFFWLLTRGVRVR